MDDPTNTWAAASTGFEFTEASKPITWQKYAFQKTGVTQWEFLKFLMCWNSPE
jgi:hypothetical protein